MKRELIKEFVSHSYKDTENAGKFLAEIVKKNDFIALYGNLGAGKTAFVRGMARILTPKAYIQSPTYTIVNEYEGENLNLYHFDMYRIASEDDLYSIGFYDYLSYEGICVVEWCENIEYAIPEKYYKVTISKDENNYDFRKISIEEFIPNENTCT